MRAHRAPRRWLALAAAAVLSSGVLTAGVLIGTAGPAAAALGTITLSQKSGKVADNPMFSSGTTSAACPSGYGENAAVRIGRPGGDHQEDFSNLAPALGGGGYDQAPVQILSNRSFATAIGGTPGDGAWLIIVRCFSLTLGPHAQAFETPIAVCGEDWFQGTACGTATETQTSLAVSPSGTAAPGETVTLTATVTPAEAGGTVTFYREDEGATSPAPIGAAPVSGGTATLETTFRLEGGITTLTTELTAEFTPGDPNAYRSSKTAQPTTLVVSVPGAAKPTAVALGVAPASPAPSGAAVTLTATVTVVAQPAAEPAGTMTFRRRLTGTSTFTDIITVPLSGREAAHTLPAGTLADGAYDFQATFVPADDDEYAGNGAVSSNYVVGEAPEATATQTTLALSPAGSAAEGADVTLTATVTPAGAAGNVEFRDGSTLLDTAGLSGGKATFETSALAIGDHSFTATFVPTKPDEYAGSAAAAQAYEITAPDDDDDDGDVDGDGDGDGDGGGGGSLASTGTPLIAIGASGLALVGLGAGALLLTRRRRPEPEPVDWPDSQP